MKYKYRFEIKYSPLHFMEANRLMHKLDLGDFTIFLTHIMTFESEEDLQIQNIKRLITEGYQDAGNKVLKIEGGKIE